MPIITSLQNPRVKNAIRLRNARRRQRQQRIIIDGARELARAIQAGVRLVEIFICEPLLAGEESQRLRKTLETCGGEILQVSEAVFHKLAFGSRAEGLLGVAEMPIKTLQDLDIIIKRPHPNPLPKGEGTFKISPTQNPLIAVLESVEKPGNVGAVLRSADAIGVSALILADARTDLYNPNAIRASLGTIFTVPVCEATSSETLAWLRENKISVVAARVDGSMPYTEIDYRRPTAVVLGSEAAGLSSAWMAADITAVRLPMLGAADSLNVSSAAAVIFYEALRQRM
ncbi:MAG: RNA methyltransferase [Thermoguttaceae bacterium]|jgi:TrmH family RNA methyltransferase